MQEKPVYKSCAVIWSSFFLRLETKSLVSVNCQSDAQTGWHTSTLLRSPLPSLSGLRETHASAPARAEKRVSKNGDAQDLFRQ